MPNYKILFSGALGYYKGQVAPASHFEAHGGAEKYVKMGAVEATDEDVTEETEGQTFPPVNPATDTSATSRTLALTDGDGISPAGEPNVAPVSEGAATAGPGKAQDVIAHGKPATTTSGK